MRAIHICLAVSIVGASLTACSNDDSNGTTTMNDASTGDTSISDASSLDGSISDAADAATALTDPQIAGVVEAVNSGEIQQAQLAQTKAVGADVIAFAAQMVSDHTKSNDDLHTLEQSIAITSASSSLQAQLQSKVQQTLASLQPLTGSAFDAAYVQSQVDAHTQVLLLLDQSLIPSAQSTQLKTFLQTTRAAVASHLQMAQALAGQASDGGVDGAADASTDAMSTSD